MDEITRRRIELASGFEDKKARDEIAKAIMEHGSGMLDTWTGLTYRKEPDDLIGKIVWWGGMFGQLVISVFTFPAALGAFLMEESAQALGMGSYLLFTAEDWASYFPYQDRYLTAIDAYHSIVTGLAVANPTTAGASLIYMDAAKMSAQASRLAALYKVKEKAQRLGIKITADMTAIEMLNLIDLTTAENAAKAIQDAQTFGTLALKSVPTYADIYLDGVSLGIQTPETFKNLTEGLHEVAVSKFNTTTGKTDVYVTTIEIVAGRKKEVTLHIPKGVSDDLVNPGAEEETEGSQLPEFIKTTVTCVKMIDGDTFETATGERVRILGMDAPEIGQAIAEESKQFMAGKLLDHKVDIKIQTHLPVDTYGRTLAIVTYRDENVAVSSIAAGLAKAYVLSDATYDPARYLEAERLAKERKVGIWNPATPGIVWRG